MGDQQRNSVLLVQTLKTSPLFLVQLRHRRVLARVVTELTRSTLPTHAPFQDVHAGPVAEFGVAQAAPTCGLRNEAFVGPRKARHNGLQRALAQVILAFKAYRRQGSRAVLENVAVLSLTTAAGERFLCCKTLPKCTTSLPKAFFFTSHFCPRRFQYLSVSVACHAKPGIPAFSGQAPKPCCPLASGQNRSPRTTVTGRRIILSNSLRFDLVFPDIQDSKMLIRKNTYAEDYRHIDSHRHGDCRMKHPATMLNDTLNDNTES